MKSGIHSDYTDNCGRFRTKSLFIEMILKVQLQDGMKPKYTLKGKEGYINIHQMYLECDDPTEYTFAIKAFGTWEHFQYMASLKWFESYLIKWREEQEVRMRSQALKTIVEVASNPDAKSISAAKYVADKGYEKKRGRPSNQDVQREKRIQAGITDEISDDAARLGLH